MSAARDLKSQQIAEIKEKIQKSKSVVLIDYKGISVADDTVLRSKCRAENVEYRVLKNRLVNLALNQLGITGFDAQLEGPTAVAFSYDDALSAAKIMSDAMKTVKAIELKGGLFDGAYTDADTVQKLATIPSKEVLLSQLVGLLQSPISGLARALQQIAEKSATA